MITPAGYLRGLRGLLEQTATSNLPRDPDEPYDPADDAPWSIVEDTNDDQ